MSSHASDAKIVAFPAGTASNGYGPWCPYFARMLRNRRITASSHFQDTRHLELDLGDSGLSYKPGGVTVCLCGVIGIGRQCACVGMTTAGRIATLVLKRDVRILHCGSQCWYLPTCGV